MGFIFYRLLPGDRLLSSFSHKNPGQLVDVSLYLPVLHMQIMNKRKGMKEPGGAEVPGFRETREGTRAAPLLLLGNSARAGKV